MKVFLSGQKSFGLAVYLMLERRGHEITGVAAPANPSNGKPDKLFAYADAYRRRLIDSASLRAGNIPPGTDLIVCAHSHAFIGRKTRHAARLGAIGYHPSLLPRHRGRDAVRWTIKMHDAITGGSVYWLDDRVDGGAIAAQEWCWVAPGETGSELWRDKLFPLGVALLNKTLSDIDAGRLVRIPQDERVATFEPALNPPRLFRPELLQISTGDNPTFHRVESDFENTLRSYSI